MKLLRSVAGFVVGYLVSFLTSVAWFLGLTDHNPSRSASAGYMVATAVFGVVFALVAGYVGASIGRDSAVGVGVAIGVFLVMVAAFTWFETPGMAHWSQVVAIVLMAPAAVVGGRWKARGL